MNEPTRTRRGHPARREWRRRSVDKRRALRFDVLARDDFRCVFCGADLLQSLDVLLAATVDHQVFASVSAAIALRGEMASCGVCNGLKGGTTNLTLPEVREIITARRRGSSSSRQSPTRLIDLSAHMLTISVRVNNTSLRRINMGTKKQKVPVTTRALIQRINRALPEFHVLKKCREGRWRNELGEYYILDQNHNAIRRKHVNLEELARELECLAEWEALTDS